MAFNGLGMNLGNLANLSSAKTRSVCAENFTGEKGKAGMSVDGIAAAGAAKELGRAGRFALRQDRAGQTFVIADIAGPGAIQHIWLTGGSTWRFTFCASIGTGRSSPPSNVRSAISSARLEEIALLNSLRSASIPAARSIATGNAVPEHCRSP